MAKSKLLPFLAIGAVAGVVVSLLDKETRAHTTSTVKKVKDTVTYYANNQEELQQMLASKTEKIQSLYTNNEEKIHSFLAGGKNGESLPKTLLSMVNETKDAFTKK